MKDLIAIEGLNNYVKIHTVAGMHIAYLTMKELEAKLEGNDSFIRVQRSFIISTDFINKVEGAFITLNNKLEVPLGTTYKNTFFLSWIKKHYGQIGEYRNKSRYYNISKLSPIIMLL